MTTEGETVGPKLPAGRHGHSREYVRDNQRARLLEAIARSVGETSYAGTSVKDVVSRAGVSRKTFYEHFSDKEDCFLQAYDQVMDRITPACRKAFEGSADWPDQVAGCLRSLIDALVAEPAMARMAMVEALSVGPKAVDRYVEAIRSFVEFIEPGIEYSPHGDALTPGVAQSVAGAINFRLYLLVARGDIEGLKGIYDELLFFALLPFVGHADAAASVERARAAAG